MWAVVVGALTAALMGAASSGADSDVRPAMAPGPAAACARAPAPGDWVRPEDDAQARPLCRAPEPAAARARADRAKRRI